MTPPRKTPPEQSFRIQDQLINETFSRAKRLATNLIEWMPPESQQRRYRYILTDILVVEADDTMYFNLPDFSAATLRALNKCLPSSWAIVYRNSRPALKDNKMGYYYGLADRFMISPDRKVLLIPTRKD